MIMQHVGLQHLVIAPPARDWESHICNSAVCSGTTWLVKRVSESATLWWVARGLCDTPALIAAVEPVCPHCSGNLAMERAQSHSYEYI